jgi:hypothetical protein
MVGSTLGGLAPQSQSAESAGVKISESDGKLRVEINGTLFTEYYYQNVSRPFLYPLIGPQGSGVTRDFPMKIMPHESQDHPHHRSVWFAHGEINGCDFWSEATNAGKTMHEKFIEVSSGKKSGFIKSQNKLIDNQGRKIGVEIQTIRFYALPKNRMFDFDVAVSATDGNITFGDTKEGTMAIRVADTMRMGKVPKPKSGHIMLSTGLRDEAAWGKRADWCDYYGPVNGKIIGIAMFDNPGNLRHPTWWHVRDYGLLAANPFGVHDFEKKSPGAGNYVLPSGQTLNFRYRIYIHDGHDQEEIAAQYEDYLKPAQKAESP